MIAAVTPLELLAVIVFAWAAVLIGACLLLSARAPREVRPPRGQTGNRW